ncbi:hypothetical protein P168DRAFT_183575 [Aspergillus campestris IBT 28561]|uniref:Uncharacterized protein n=1 Tax=Aspergillus campestris (strain IBT 28561) TaxID=1392248 RepID=A0A2I1CXR7_ASPC2|nr:uncharacterized protein P168DRAFT_183575 [Aspergillus campestris IBT 28561]PKY02414.1 hypothetical protein P168DRAFT_183575 [Aspergillus campestris IBT 28561]
MYTMCSWIYIFPSAMPTPSEMAVLERQSRDAWMSTVTVMIVSAVVYIWKQFKLGMYGPYEPRYEADFGVFQIILDQAMHAVFFIKALCHLHDEPAPRTLLAIQTSSPVTRT